MAEGYLSKEFGVRTKRYCQTMELKDDAAPENFDWDSAMARLATLPRQEEWEAHVAQFQQCAANATSDEKWQMMERIFYLY